MRSSTPSRRAARKSRRRWPNAAWGDSKDNPHLAAKAALLTRAAKRDIDRAALECGWQRQAKALGFSAGKVRAQARKAERGLLGPDLFAGPGWAAGDAVAWAVGHIAERQTVFGHACRPAGRHAGP